MSDALLRQVRMHSVARRLFDLTVAKSRAHARNERRLAISLPFRQR